MGLTDAMPAATAQSIFSRSPRPFQKKRALEAKTVTLRGRCVDHVDSSALAGARVRLFKAQGRTSPIVEIAKSVTDARRSL